MRKILKHLISIIIAIIIVLLIQAFVITGSVVKDNTMSPNLKENDRIFVNKIKPTFDLLDNNDIIMYRNGDDIQYSRIIGKPGQSIAFKGGKLIRDDRQVDEPFTQNSIENLSLRDIKNSESDIIPPNAYFVLNDQRTNKHDSRTLGYIKKEDIIGNVSMRYYPFKKFTVDFN
ncbi:signal peptidase I [Staphylococcus saprophyticus]|uniref:signal peptidase I n=3 Tax=Staphylococcus saprophyticus TaxID=29385 RepID=UPI0007B556F3|nr:signal peptidase I [Staphylococcus saprophyticus]MBC2921638.1 signal peptidase I [Staphylococcus saprophyticus]MBC2957651.1 signal peptidase I [Staphylococcus saprophyticus]MBC3009748.1 signal peptidase I [Staphylococcus saprophyticus]MBC3023957.1 signal peptidase I [Staphylococcus saprophyticus]MBC3030964.1 signal peptidase I [Staphylococcus saprophyticus]